MRQKRACCLHAHRQRRDVARGRQLALLRRRRQRDVQPRGARAAARVQRRQCGARLRATRVSVSADARAQQRFDANACAHECDEHAGTAGAATASAVGTPRFHRVSSRNEVSARLRRSGRARCPSPPAAAPAARTRGCGAPRAGQPTRRQPGRRPSTCSSFWQRKMRAAAVLRRCCGCGSAAAARCAEPQGRYAAVQSAKRTALRQ